MTATRVRFGTERTLRVDDAPAVTEILAAIERAEPTDEALSEQDVRDELGAPDVDLPRASIGVLDGDRLVGFGVLQFSVPTDVWKVAVVGGVHPDYVGRGIGRRILEILQADARAIRDSEAPGSPGLFRVWVPEGRSRTAALAQALGLETWRYFLRMRRDLGDPLPAPTMPDGVLIQPYKASDELAVMEVSNASFADHWGSTPLDIERWRAEYTEASWFRPEFSQIAVIEDQLVGFVFVVEYDAETELRGYRSGYLSRVGTLRRARGRSVASTLIATTLQQLCAAGFRCAELGVDAESLTGAGRLYERLGFVTTARDSLVGRKF